MGNQCTAAATCCSSDTLEQNFERSTQRMTTVSIQSLQDMQVPDEQELRKLESMMQLKVAVEMFTVEICQRSSQPVMFELLKKNEKTLENYEVLVIRDGQLQFGQLQIGSLKYLGQTRVLRKSQARVMQGKQGEYENQEEIVRCGYGKLCWPDGSVFEGYWLNGIALSIGVFKTSEQEVFEGIWQQDKATGLSVFRKSDFSDSLDKQNGKGIEVWSDGSYYNGNFYEGVKQGHGVYYWADGSRYQGDWISDEMSGKGVFQWSDGRNFEGEFKSGVMHGEGVYTWQDGRRYEGEYSCNKKHGQGTYTYSDGSKYTGEWLDGLQHGVGSILDTEGTYERKGIWANGKLKSWLGTQSV